MTDHCKVAEDRARWIWEQYNKNGQVTTIEIKAKFRRQGRELEKELRLRGIELPPILTASETMAHEQSRLLMAASGGKAMTTREMAAALTVHYYSVKAIRKKLIGRGLPCPPLKRDRKQPDIDHVKLPDNLREQVSTRYPSKLEAISCRYIEINGEIKIAYLLW